MNAVTSHTANRTNMPPKRPVLTLDACWRASLRPPLTKQQEQEGAPARAPYPPPNPAPAPASEPVSADAVAPEPDPVSTADEVSSDSGSSHSDDPVSRKARKLLTLRRKKRCDAFAYAMQHGKFPKPGPGSQQPPQEHPMLTDAGYLWNAVPPRYCQYLDMEAVHEGSTSAGSTGSSEGSLDDPDFIVKDLLGIDHTEDELQVLQRMFPKTFKSKPQ